MTEEQYEFIGGVQMKLVDHLGGRDIFEISHLDLLSKDHRKRYRGYADGVSRTGSRLTISFHIEPVD
jgi:hypothetical protein